MASARSSKKPSSSARAKARPGAPAKVKPKPAAKASAKAKPGGKGKPQASGKPRSEGKPAQDPTVARLTQEIESIDAQLAGAALDLVTRVKLTSEKKDLQRRIADLKGDKPFLTKVPKHKEAA